MRAPERGAAPEQLVLDLPHRAALAVEDFLISACNEAAIALIDNWPGWSAPAAIVAGPPGSGKSHLTHVWMLRAGGERVSARDLDEPAIKSLERTGAMAVEDIDAGPFNERIMFHLLNLAREKGHSILLTSRTAPGDFQIMLPDLRSRLRALPVVHIAPPDDDLLRAVLVKLFHDRQLDVEPHVIAHLALHMERSFQAAQRLVERCDQLALSRQRRVTRSLAAEALSAAAACSEDPPADGQDGGPETGKSSGHSPTIGND